MSGAWKADTMPGPKTVISKRGLNMKEAIPSVENAKSGEWVDWNKECITVLDGVIYAHTEDGFLRMDCLWDGTIDDPKRPAIIWIHGGGFIEPNATRKNRPEERFLTLLRKGYLIAAIDYRISQVRPFPSQIQDCKCAVRYLRANAKKIGIDPARIGVWGESCGGQLAGLMSVKGGIEGFEDFGGYEGISSNISCAVSWYGALDVMEFHRLRMAVDEQYPKSFEIMYGGNPYEMDEMLTKASPLTYAEKPCAPLLALCSDGDSRVSYTVNIEFCKRGTAAGNVAEFVLVPNQEHGYIQGGEYDQKVFDFFEKWL